MGIVLPEFITQPTIIVKMKLVFTLLLFACIGTTAAQSVAVNTDGSTAHASSIMDVKSNTKGMLLPRMTTNERNAISNPEKGLLVFDTDKNSFVFFDGQNWNALAFTSPSLLQPIERTLGGEESAFGNAVAISGNYIIAGAFNDTVNGVKAGAAYILHKGANGNWVQQARLTAPDGTGSARFGFSVDIDGDYAIVGASNKQVNGLNFCGKVYIYHRNGDAWELEASFTEASPQGYVYFGSDVAISVNSSHGVVAVGSAHYATVGGASHKGRVTAFRRSAAGVWSLQQTISSGQAVANDFFGFSVDVDGDIMVIGAPGTDVNGINAAGAAYIWTYSAAGWLQQTRLTQTKQDGQFGYACSMEGARIAIAAPGAAYTTGYSAPVYVYTVHSTLGWVNSAVIFIQEGTLSMNFGVPLSFSGDYLIIGAPAASIGSLGNVNVNNIPGQVYLYKNYSTNKYTLQQKFSAPVPRNNDAFGISVGMSASGYVLSYFLKEADVEYNSVQSSIQIGSVN
jgi:hypothetical protein